MKTSILILLFSAGLYSCHSNKTAIKGDAKETTQTVTNDTIRIVNEELDYEILIIEIGFNNWLVTQPQMGHYGLNYLENRNRLFVIEYNIRVQQSLTRKLYEQEINYEPTIRYGLEVNYLLYNYFIYFQQKYKQKL